MAEFEKIVHQVEDAAVQAEFDTGERESSVEEAKSHIAVRVARMGLGFLICILGVIALPLPGPGWVIILAGLALLAKDFEWAARLITYIRRTIPGVPEDGRIPARTWVIIGVISAAALGASLWWNFWR